MSEALRVDWHARAADLAWDGRPWIEGERRAAALDLDKHSPVDGRRLGAYGRCQAAEVDAAVHSARRAFEDGRWARQSPASRKRVLQRWSELVLAAREELALRESLDMGKPVRNAWQVDVPATARCLAWYGEAIDKVYGEVAPTAANALALITREPMGVIGCIVPWNYPLIMAAWKLGPALAAGNSVVLKPSERSPYTALRLAELALEAGLPPGVLNVVPGLGHEAGEALALHPGVDAIGFTGSTGVGRRMFEYAARSNLKRVYNELGGKSAFLVFADHEQPEQAAEAAAASLFFNQGESCNAPSRVLVQEEIADRFTEALLAATQRHAAAHPLDWGAPMGALVDGAHLRGVLAAVDSGRAEGARLLCGGAAAPVTEGGSYMQPTLFDRAHNQMRIARDEIFGPVITLLRFRTEPEAVQIANDSPYGLQASVWSHQLSRAHRVARALRAGTVHVNQYDEDDITVPFGGVKQSGNGRDKSLHALEKYTELKTTWIQIDE